jgi:hypothetical protein
MAVALSGRLRPGGFVLLIIPLIALTIHYGYDAYLADSCLEQGGSINYETMQCSLTDSFPYVSYLSRHGFKVALACGLSFTGFLLTMLTKSRKQSS